MVCELAKKAGCGTWKDGANCATRRREYQDGPWWIPHRQEASAWHRKNFGYDASPERLGAGRVSCAARLVDAPAFHAVESALPGGKACPGFFSIALMRPPLERLVSHSMELAKWGMVVPSKQGFCRNYSHMRALAPPVYDNYYVRMLLGEQGVAAPVGSLTREHLVRARRVLSTLDLVLDSNEPRTPLALHYATGLANFTACRAPSSQQWRCAMSEEDSARAVRDNALDLKLYAFAKNLSEGHVTEILRRATHPTQPQATRHYPSVEA